MADIYPVKMNMYIDTDIHVIKGGGAEDFINKVDLHHNSLIHRLGRLTKYKFNKYLFSKDTEWQFKFNEKNTKHEKKSRYLAHGTYTAVYGIELMTNQTLIPERYRDKLILRISKIEQLDDFIEEWKSHKQKFGENIIDIYLYGNVFTKTKSKYNEIGQYIITREYYNSSNIDSLPIDAKINILYSLLNFLKKIEIYEYSYDDLKYANIGYDIINGNFIFIVLDYDNITLQPISERTKSVNTYRPIFTVIEKKINYKYLHVSGLASVIALLFYNLNTKAFNKIIQYLNGNIRYYSFLSSDDLRRVSALYENMMFYITMYEVYTTEQHLLYALLIKIITICLNKNIDEIIAQYNLTEFIDELSKFLKTTPKPESPSKTPTLTQPESPSKTPTLTQPESPSKTPTLTQPESPSKTPTLISPNSTSKFESVAGGYYEQKYLKYKQKYLNLKSLLTL
jgi:hypothetical protein